MKATFYLKFARILMVGALMMPLSAGAAGLNAATSAGLPVLLTKCAAKPTTPGGWQQVFRTLPRAGDGYLSTPLIDGRIAWMFGDTARLDSHDFIHNMLVITCGNQIQQVGTAEAIPNQADGSYYWGGPGLVDNGRLYMLVPHLKPSTAWPYFASLGTDVAMFDVAMGQQLPVFRGLASTPSSNRSDGVQWGAGLVATGGYVYVYGHIQPTGAWGQSIRVARVPAGQLGQLSAWRFWDGLSWNVNEAAAVNVIDAAVDGTDTAFSARIESGQVVITTKRGGAYSSDVGQFKSSSPVGPFTWTTLKQVPTTDSLHTYLASDHPETGISALTVNQQPQGRPWPDDVWTNPDDYRAQWLAY